jgi:hypothetical protein
MDTNAGQPVGLSHVRLAGPARAFYDGMSLLSFKVSQKSGEFVKPTLVPANHSAQSRFGLLDGAIVGFFLLCMGGLIYLLLHI